MNVKQLKTLLAKVKRLYIDRSFHSQINDETYAFNDLYSIFKEPILKNLQSYLNEKANLPKLVHLLSSSEELKENLDNDYSVFFIGTLLSKADFICRAKQSANWDEALEQAMQWADQNADKLTSYWHIHKKALKADKITKQKTAEFLLTIPLYHEKQFSYLELFDDEYYRKWFNCHELVASNSEKKFSSQIDDLSVYMQMGPFAKDGIAVFIDYIKDLIKKDCHLIFALGITQVGNSKTFMFPYQLVDTPVGEDFYDYFTIDFDEFSLKLYNDKYKLWGMPPIEYDTDGFRVYRLNQDLLVKVRKLDGYTLAKDPSAIISHDCYTTELLIFRLNFDEKPHRIVVHSHRAPDNNPLNLTPDQLNLFIKSLVKAHYEGVSTAIHCHAGLGRSGVLGYVAAKILCPEMPDDPVQALTWLRGFRPGVIHTAEQLMDAERTAKIAQAKLSPYKTIVGYDWQRLYEDNNLANHLNAAFVDRADSAVRCTPWIKTSQPVLTNGSSANGHEHYAPVLQPRKNLRTEDVGTPKSKKARNDKEAQHAEAAANALLNLSASFKVATKRNVL